MVFVSVSVTSPAAHRARQTRPGPCACSRSFVLVSVAGSRFSPRSVSLSAVDATQSLSVSWTDWPGGGACLFSCLGFCKLPLEWNCSVLSRSLSSGEYCHPALFISMFTKDLFSVPLLSSVCGFNRRQSLVHSVWQGPVCYLFTNVCFLIGALKPFACEVIVLTFYGLHWLLRPASPACPACGSASHTDVTDAQGVAERPQTRVGE